jgi:hypothetical protein
MYTNNAYEVSCNSIAMNKTLKPGTLAGLQPTILQFLENFDDVCSKGMKSIETLYKKNPVFLPKSCQIETDVVLQLGQGLLGEVPDSAEDRLELRRRGKRPEVDLDEEEEGPAHDLAVQPLRQQRLHDSDEAENLKIFEKKVLEDLMLFIK